MKGTAFKGVPLHFFPRSTESSSPALIRTGFEAGAKLMAYYFCNITKA